MRLGKWGGVNVYIHWTFWVLIAFYLVTVSLQSGPLAGVVVAAFVLSVFACVALHEFGHAGAAAYYGIRTVDITLLPIGGMARLERLPEKPYQELVIALAGPAVNFAIAAVLAPLLLLVPMSLPGPALLNGELGFVGQLLFANLVLAIFNLLPAFPMDGGR
ncbi:MAG: site-2 protease family protein, partial [Aureliella sp.]